MLLTHNLRPTVRTIADRFDNLKKISFVGNSQKTVSTHLYVALEDCHAFDIKNICKI